MPATDLAPQLSGRLPENTSITQMLSLEEGRSLTKAASHLTKADLLALAGLKIPAKSPKDLHLDVQDIRSISQAFHENQESGLKSNDLTINKCCCTPCCCCAGAVVEALRPLS